VGVLGFSIMGLRATEKGRGHFAHKILIVLMAMTNYIALAFTQGVERAGEYTYFGYARFIDCSVTTPLLLLGLELLALPRARDSLPLVLSIMAVDLYMIATGLFAGLSGEGRGVWWAWFIVSSLAFVVLYAMIFGPLAKKAREKIKAGEAMQRSGESVERYLGTIHMGEGRLFAPMAGLLALIWLINPVIFFLDEQGIGAYPPDYRRPLHHRRRRGQGRLRLYLPGRHTRHREARSRRNGTLAEGDGGVHKVHLRAHPPRGRRVPPQARGAVGGLRGSGAGAWEYRPVRWGDNLRGGAQGRARGQGRRR
jgi:hypothetical protein